MKQIIFIIFILFNLNSYSQDVKVRTIERKVYRNDSLLYTFNSKDYTDHDLTAMRSSEIIKNIDYLILNYSFHESDTSIKDEKYVIYKIQLSNENKVIIKSSKSIQLIDNAIMFGYGFEGDESFELYWWYEEGELEIIMIPGHPKLVPEDWKK